MAIRQSTIDNLPAGETDYRSRRGFTLIELLVVIAIISLLVSVLLPSLSQARELAKQVVCMSNLKQFALGIGMYRNDNGENYPYGLLYGSPQGTLDYALVFPDYISSKDMKCPTDTVTAYTDGSWGEPTGYAMSYSYGAAGFCWAQPYDDDTPATYRLMFDFAVIYWRPPHGGKGSNCLLVGYEVKWIPAEDYAADFYPDVEP